LKKKIDSLENISSAALLEHFAECHEDDRSQNWINLKPLLWLNSHPNINP